MGTQELHKSVNEKDVENLYRHSLLKKFKDMEITSPFGCDGFAVSKQHRIRTLLEFKDDLNLNSKLEQSKVLAQAIYYVKKFYDKGQIPPSTIFVGNRNECLALHVNSLLKYLEMDLDWSIAPSSAHKNVELMSMLMEDQEVCPFVFNADHFEQCVNKIKDLTDNVQRKVIVTDKNITEVFRYFEDKILTKSCELKTNERANLFVQLLVNNEENYLHPFEKRSSIVTKTFGEIKIKSRNDFKSFFAHFESSYKPSQKHKLTAVVDRIVEDVTRRKQGEFFTPAIWVDKAHEYIASVYGDDWKEKYVVWDPAWGTGNLTRDYKFKELYASTLNQSDIDTANQMGYNPEATKFQYDFLNDDYEKLPKRLRNAIEEGRQIIVLMNPPYGRANDGGKISTVQKNSTISLVSEMMKNDGWGKSSAQLYAQFIYRVTKIIPKVNICVFSKALVFVGDSFKLFREKLFNEKEFLKGFVMNSSGFADVGEWPLTFFILSSKK
jgi:predicted RNA methylase